MHPLHDGLKTASFEDLEQRKTAVHKRMQILRRTQNHNQEIWNQLESILDAIILEQQERYLVMRDKSPSESPIVVNTDPLDIDQQPQTVPQRTPFRPVS